MAKFQGYLFSKLTAIGTRSEDTIYFLQQLDNKEILVLRTTDERFKPDPVLHKHLATKVVIDGILAEQGIKVEKIVSKG